MDGDKISTLPVNDNDKLPDQDQHLLDILLEDKKDGKNGKELPQDIKDVKKVSVAFKEAILGGLLFLLLSHSSFDNLVRLSGCKSEFTVLLLKFAIFVILYFILQNKFFNAKKN
jgi:hypothetical protein